MTSSRRWWRMMNNASFHSSPSQLEEEEEEKKEKEREREKEKEGEVFSTTTTRRRWKISKASLSELPYLEEEEENKEKKEDKKECSITTSRRRWWKMKKTSLSEVPHLEEEEEKEKGEEECSSTTSRRRWWKMNKASLSESPNLEEEEEKKKIEEDKEEEKEKEEEECSSTTSRRWWCKMNNSSSLSGPPYLEEEEEEEEEKKEDKKEKETKEFSSTTSRRRWWKMNKASISEPPNLEKDKEEEEEEKKEKELEGYSTTTTKTSRRKPWRINKAFFNEPLNLEEEDKKEKTEEKKEKEKEQEQDQEKGQGQKQEECSLQVMKELCAYLEESLPHTFDHGWKIDYSHYEDGFQFRDPINKINNLNAYLFNIHLLRWLFAPTCQLHRIAQTGPNEIRARWSMTMDFHFLPWRPQLSFTGTSVIMVNPRTQKLCSHVDYWDSIKNNNYFSYEALIDIFKQIHLDYTIIDQEIPRYKVLKRTMSYEVRDYEPFVVVETNGDSLYNSKIHFKEKNQGEQISITTPIFMEEFRSSLLDQVKIKSVCRGVFAVTKFTGIPTRNNGKEKERKLRVALAHDGLKAKDGFLVATYTKGQPTRSFVRNEVLLSLEDRTLKQRLL